MLYKRFYFTFLSFKFFVFLCNLILQRLDKVFLREIFALYQIKSASDCAKSFAIIKSGSVGITPL